MTDKEFRHLNRSELVEIIYQLQQRERDLQNEVTELREQIAAQELKQTEYGSIAEAVVGLSNIFEIAQRTADRYLQEIYNATSDTQAMIEAAKREANEIIEKAENESKIKRFEADREILQKWNMVLVNNTGAKT